MVGLEVGKTLQEVGGPKKHNFLLKFLAVSQMASLFIFPWTFTC